MYRYIKWLNVVKRSTLKSQNVCVKVASAFQNLFPASEVCLLPDMPTVPFPLQGELPSVKDKLVLKDAAGLGRMGDFCQWDSLPLELNLILT